MAQGIMPGSETDSYHKMPQEVVTEPSLLASRDLGEALKLLSKSLCGLANLNPKRLHKPPNPKP